MANSRIRWVPMAKFARQSVWLFPKIRYAISPSSPTPNPPGKEVGCNKIPEHLSNVDMSNPVCCSDFHLLI